MANEKETAELNAMAFEIYKERVTGGKRGTEAEAVQSFALAETFLRARAAVARGDVKSVSKDATGPRLCDVCAPNLARTSPHNLVSKRFGSLDRVAKIKAWLDRNPTPEKDPDELVGSINSEFPDLGWDMPAINVARAIFPAYVRN